MFCCAPVAAAVIVWAGVFAVPAVAGTAGPDGWANAIQVPGTAALNTGDNAETNVVSCPSAGNCVAGGYYTAGGVTLPFVVSETNGTWNSAKALPVRGSSVNVVSCKSPGNCAIGLNGPHIPLVDSEVNGTWGRPEPIPGMSQLTASAGIAALSCSAPGECTVGGGYAGKSAGHAFLDNEVNGVWGKAFQAPGTDLGGGAAVKALSCPSAGNCTASGIDDQHAAGPGAAGPAFVADEVHGVWGKAIQVPGTSGYAQVDASTVSCSTAGNCGVGGVLNSKNGTNEPFVDNEVHGVWAKATVVPGMGALNTGDDGSASSISCPTAGDCTVTGVYVHGVTAVQAFVASEVSGTWRPAETVPGTAALSRGAYATGDAVSCASPGNCSIAGTYSTEQGGLENPFLADQVNGSWHTAIAAPGVATLSNGAGGAVIQVSCGEPGNCSAAGFYSPKKFSNGVRALVISRS
jgi:hypothetical protein